MDLPDRRLSHIIKIAKKKKIKGLLEISNRKDKRFKITLEDGKVIHFGLWKPKVGTYFDFTLPNKGEVLMNRGFVEKRRTDWIARHSKIIAQDSYGNEIQAIKYKYSPDYYSYHLLW